VRRIVIIIALVAVVGIAGYMLLRPRSGAKRAVKQAASDAVSTAKTGRKAGKIKSRTKQELAEEKRKRKAEERKRKRELKRQERERKRRLRYARKRRGRRGRRRKGQLYVVSAIVSLGSDSYALVDGRRVGVGDVIMGRRIVSIQPDRLVVDAFGKTTTVRVGESVVPFAYADRRRR
jgi:hypothetical protein